MAKINKWEMPLASQIPELLSPDGATIPFAKLLSIDVDNISAEIEIQAAWQATIGYAYAMAESSSTAAKRNLDRIKARLHAHYQSELTAAGMKVTEKTLSNTVLVDPAVIKAEDELTACEQEAMILDTAYKAFLTRKDMLVQLSAGDRAGRERVIRHVDNE